MAKNEIYVSTDIEADGPIPGPHSMLSFASVAFDADGQELGSFSANLEPLHDAEPHPGTMAWWERYPEAWAACRQSPRPAQQVMAEYLAWLKALPGTPIFTGWPAGWDFMFIYWYLIRFTGERPFSETSLDIRSYAMAVRKKGFLRCGKNYLPTRWQSTAGQEHVALDDARAQGLLFINMLKEHSAGS